jgi:hypothetical protein
MEHQGPLRDRAPSLGWNVSFAIRRDQLGDLAVIEIQRLDCLIASRLVCARTWVDRVHPVHCTDGRIAGG